MEFLILGTVILVSLWLLTSTVGALLMWRRGSLLNRRLEQVMRDLHGLCEHLDVLRSRLDEIQGVSRRPPAAEADARPSDAAPAPPPTPATEAVPYPPRAEKPPPSFDSVTAPPPRPRPTSPELEALIGGNWLPKIGILAVVLGVLYFLKYAFDNQWIGDTGRVLLGGLAGLGLLYGGERFHVRGYPLYGQTVAAGGISVLYLSIYAAFNFYSLLGQAPALVLMALVTAVGMVLAARRESRTLALLSLIGGLLTPYWLSTGTSNQVGLLGYLLILDLGTGLLARSRGWAFLNAVSLGGTVLLFAGWADRFYTREAMWTTQIFLVLFAALYLFLSTRRLEPVPASKASVSLTRAVAAIAVFLFFFSSHAVLEHEAAYYWVFLILFDAAALVSSVRFRIPLVYPLAFLLNAVGIAIWTAASYRAADQALVFVLASCVFAIFVAGQVLRRLWSLAPADTREVLVCIATGLGYFGLSYRLLEDGYGGWMGLFAVALALLYLLGARALSRLDAASQPVVLAFVGVSITLVTLAIPIQLQGGWITLAWCAESAVLTWIGFSSGSIRLRQAGLVVLALGLIRLLQVDVRPPAEYALLFNRRFLTWLGSIAAVYAVALLYRRNSAALQPREPGVLTILMIAGSALSVFLMSLESHAWHDDRVRGLSLALARESLSAGEHAVRVAEAASSRQLVLSVIWAAYSVASVVCGFIFRYRPIRLFGIGLFFVAILKVFAVDIWTLDRLYRIISVISLGILLLLAAYMYQRFDRRVSSAGTESR